MSAISAKVIDPNLLSAAAPEVGLGGRSSVRVVFILALVFSLLYIVNLREQDLGFFSRLPGPEKSLAVGAVLVAISVVALSTSGIWRMMQARGKIAVLDLAAAGVALVLATFGFGIGPSPFNLCFGGGGGYTCYATSSEFLVGFASLMSLVVAEELLFRAYLINELSMLSRVGRGAWLASALIYTLFHFPSLVNQTGNVSLSAALQIMIGAVSLSGCYWYSGRNLIAVAIVHAYWDGIGALLLVPVSGLLGPFIVLLAQLSLPALAVVAIHSLWTRFRSPEKIQGLGALTKIGPPPTKMFTITASSEFAFTSRWTSPIGM
jgi:membrane protease YdiL (CAAX protease family)